MKCETCNKTSDNEDDFAFAETIIQYLKKPKDTVKKYYSIDK